MKNGLPTRSINVPCRETEACIGLLRTIPPATDAQLLDPNQCGPALFHYSNRQ